MVSVREADMSALILADRQLQEARGPDFNLRMPIGPWADPSKPAARALDSHTWLVATTPSSGSVKLYTYGGGGAIQETELPEGTVLGSPGPAGILAWSLMPPFFVHTISPTGRRSHSTPSPAGVADFAGVPVGMAILAVHGRREYLRTYADLATDRRVLVRLDSEFQIVNEVTIESPFAFVASDAETSSILAVQNSGAVELVLYRYIGEVGR